MNERSKLSWPMPLSPPELTYDLDIKKSLDQSPGCLFVSREPIEVHFAWVDSEGKTSVDILENECDIEECAVLPGNHKRDRTDSACVAEGYDPVGNIGVRASYFVINPAITRGELPVTLNGMIGLLAGLQAFPGIHRHLTAFGRKSFSKDEGFGGYDWAESVGTDGSLSIFESCYLLKYVQKRPRAGVGVNPWSISQSLVYQKVFCAAKRTDHLLVKPSDAFTNRLHHYLSQGHAVAANIASDWTRVHSMGFGSVDDSFRDCFNFLDERISEIFGRVMMSGVEPGKLRELDTLESSSKDMKSLQAFVDMALRVKHIIDVNLETLDAMTHVLSGLRVRHSSPSPTQIDSLLRSLANIQHQHRMSMKNFSSMIERANSLSEQLRNVISIRNSAATIELTVRSGYEAHVIKILTLLALIFMPASFVSDFLQLDYVSKVDSAEFRLSATDDLQMYAVLALPLILITMLVYGGVEFYQRWSWKRSIGSRSSMA